MRLGCKSVLADVDGLDYRVAVTQNKFSFDGFGTGDHEQYNTTILRNYYHDGIG